MENLVDINSRLKDRFGIDTFSGYPKFRVVWSDDQREMRYAEVNVYVSQVFLRTERGVQLLQKYPFIKERYVFEFFCPTNNPELPEGGKNYEPLYVFENKEKKPLPVVWWVVEFLADVLSKKQTPTIKSVDEEKIREYQEYFDVLDDVIPETPAKIVRGEGVVLENTDFWKGK